MRFLSPPTKTRTFTAVLLLTLIFSVSTGMSFLLHSKANSITESLDTTPSFTRITLESPSAKLYTTDSVTLKFTAVTNGVILDSYYYVLDDTTPVKINDVEVTNTAGRRTWNPSYAPWYPYDLWTEYTLEGNALLSDLTEGWHTIQVYQGLPEYGFVSGLVRFGATYGGNISLLSPEEATFSSSSISVCVSTFDPLSYFNSYKYCLDGQGNSSLPGGNRTLNDLDDGVHTLKVYAEHVDYTFSTGLKVTRSVSSEVHFNITTATPTPSPSPSPSPSPTQEPTPEPTPTTTSSLSLEPTVSVTSQVTISPSQSATAEPTVTQSEADSDWFFGSVWLVAVSIAILIAIAVAAAFLFRQRSGGG